MKRTLLCIMALTLTVTACGRREQRTEMESGGTLTILCGAGIRPALEPIRKEFERLNNCTVRANYAGSGTLLGQLQAGVEADLYLPGDIWWVEKARDMGMVDSQTVVAWFVPVIAVQKGNPKGIRGVEDLAREDLAVGLGKPEACAVGNVSRTVMAAAGMENKVRASFEALTVNRLADQIKLNALDATIIWGATAKQYPGAIDRVRIKDSDFHAVALAVGVLNQGDNLELARQFAAFIAGDFGAKCFRENHYQVPGPQLRVSCGASMRLPFEELSKLFEVQTGRKVLRDYGGSGTILIHLQESQEGDVYICHDPYPYVCEDKKISQRWHTLAYMEPILAVQKGNPKNVRGLKDLMREDLKIGLSHREYSTRGQMLWAMLRKQGMADTLEKRVFFEERTHTLVNQLKLGAVDVATLWDAPAKAMEDIEVVPIEEEYQVDAVTSATSGRTYSIKQVKVAAVRLTFSSEPLLAAQFAKLCVSDAGREILKKHHFQLPEQP